MAGPARIAAIVTTFFPNSHAGVLAAKFLTASHRRGADPPRTRIASLYMDQIHRNDVGLQLARQYDVPVYQSIPAALTLGTGELAVDGVLLIGEHGDYPRTILGQEMLPRGWLFEQVCGVIAEHGRPVPVFVDKHLSYRWSDARWMYDTARELRVPLWAGSSLPSTGGGRTSSIRSALRSTRRSPPASTCWSGTASTRWSPCSARWSAARAEKPASWP